MSVFLCLAYFTEHNSFQIHLCFVTKELIVCVLYTTYNIHVYI